MFKGLFTLNFIPMELKELLAEKETGFDLT
jgi:hypothetical protein